MKKLQTFLVLLATSFLLGSQVMAQVPQGIPYQGAARDARGNVLANQVISLEINIHDVTATGRVVFHETHTVKTKFVKN